MRRNVGGGRLGDGRHWWRVVCLIGRSQQQQRGRRRRQAVVAAGGAENADGRRAADAAAGAAVAVAETECPIGLALANEGCGFGGVARQIDRVIAARGRRRRCLCALTHRWDARGAMYTVLCFGFAKTVVQSLGWI